MNRITQLIIDTITDLVFKGFYGKLTISFEKGKIVTWNVSENFKP